MSDKVMPTQVKQGRWVRVRFDDIGHVDAIIVNSTIVGGKLESPDNIRVLLPACDWDEQGVSMSQITKVGNYVTCKETGL